MSTIWNFTMSKILGKKSSDNALKNEDYNLNQKKYCQIFNERNSINKNDPKTNGLNLTRQYYDLATDFYEYGWGKCFHFAPRYKGETLTESIKRHEYYLSSQIGLNEQDTVLDAGCGIMGPARNICRFSGAKITGINLNAYQVKRSIYLNNQFILNNKLDCIQGDFTATNFPDNHFDKIYSIEAFCHSTDRLSLYKEMYRILKPGGIIGMYDWVMTEKYNKNDNVHNDIKYWIEKGNGIASLLQTKDLVAFLKEAGFEITICEDLASYNVSISKGNDVEWYSSFVGSFSFSQFKHTFIGRYFTQLMCDVLEKVKIAPNGTSDMHKILIKNAIALENGGKLGVFTPLLFIVAKKPKSETE